MAQNQPAGVTDEELEAAREAILEQRDAIREDLDAAGVDVSSWGETDEAEE